MLHELAGYPVRPTRQPGESLAGYISRHFGTNGHWMPNALHRAISTLYRSESATQREEAWTLICRLTGQDSPVDRRQWLDQRFTVPEAAPRKMRRTWQRAALSPIRICPNCLAEHGVHLSLWELPLVEACHVHGCLLIQRCDCGRELVWPGLGPNWSCRCGKPLSSLVSSKAPREIQRITQAIVAACDLVGPSLTAIPGARVASDLRQTYDLVYWLQELLQLVVDASRHPVSIERKPGRRLGRLLNDWPVGLELRIVRLLRFRHRHERGSVFLLLDDTHPTRRLLNYLSSAETNSKLPDAAILVARSVCEALVPPVGTPQALIFNPALPLAERRRRLQALMNWWLGLLTWMEWAADAHYAPCPSSQYIQELDERFRVLLLNVLINAAISCADPQRFRRFAQAWPPSRPFVRAKSPDEFLMWLDSSLRTASSAHLQYLCELACGAAGVVRGQV